MQDGSVAWVSNLNMEIEILYEDSDYVVVDKPSGLVVHSDGKTEEPTLVDWILNHYPGLSGVGEPLKLSDGTMIDRPGIVHRLDRETSGVIVIAKDQNSFLHFKERLKNRETSKIYNAFVYGKLKHHIGVMDRKIGKSRKDFRMWSAQRGARGTMRDAITEYNVLKERDEASFLEVRPITGRTHQIRVHMKAIHHPVVCDKLYAPNNECILGFERLALHASSIAFLMPDEKWLKISSSLPPDFKRALEAF